MTLRKLAGFKRRALVPCLILFCVLLYAWFFVSYVTRSSASSIQIETASSTNIHVITRQTRARSQLVTHLTPQQNSTTRPGSTSLPTTTMSPTTTLSPSPTRSPTTKKICNILVARGGDKGAGFATLIYAYPINFQLYALTHNYTLWLDYTPKFNDLYYDALHGPNAFEYYFEPIQPDWSVCDRTRSNLTKLTKGEINPGIHTKERSSIHMWYYHFRKWGIAFNRKQYLSDWYYEQRSTGHTIVSSYFHLKPEIVAERDAIWSAAFGAHEEKELQILGVQMRGSDKVQKWSIRREVRPAEYMPYIASFVHYHGEKARVFFATDDRNYFAFLKEHWPDYVRPEYSFQHVVVTQANVTRSEDHTAIFNFEHVSKYNIGREVLLDILLLALCDWFIHSATAVAEAVFFNNLDLHNHSVHLEYTIDRQVPFWFRNETLNNTD